MDKPPVFINYKHALEAIPEAEAEKWSLHSGVTKAAVPLVAIWDWLQTWVKSHWVPCQNVQLYSFDKHAYKTSEHVLVFLCGLLSYIYLLPPLRVVLLF